MEEIIRENLLSLFEIQTYFNQMPLKKLTEAQNNASLFKVYLYFYN